MHSIFAELFVHPWWVDALIIGGMLAALYLLLMGLKRIWHCIKKGKKTQTANDYNEKLFKTATENTDNSIQMKFTENAILTARESLHSPEMIMGDKLEVLTENESEINDDEITRVGSIHHTKSKSSTINSKKEVQFKENSDNKDNNDDGFDENKDNGSHGDYIEYQNDGKNKNNNNSGNENENIENIENKKKGSKHYKNDPSLTGIMHGIGGIMSNLRDSGDLNNMSIGISELEFSDDESDDDQLHKQDLRKSLKLAGASSFILRQLKTLSVRHLFGDGDEDTPAAPGIAEGTDGIEGVPGVGSEAAMNSKGKDVVVGPSIDEGDNEDDDNEDENEDDNVDDNQSDKSF